MRVYMLTLHTDVMNEEPVKEKEGKEKRFRLPWIDTLAAIIATYEILIVPFIILVVALLLITVIFRILFV